MGDVLNWVFIRIFGIFAGMGKLKESVEMIAKFFSSAFGKKDG